MALHPSLKIIWTLTLATILVCPIMISYILRVPILQFDAFAIGLYGILVFTHYFFQAIFAWLNKKQVNKLAKEYEEAIRKNQTQHLTAGLLVVGYRENEDYFRNCLEATKLTDYPGFGGLIVVIDGNSEDDTYMGDIFMDVFKGYGELFNLDFTLEDYFEKDPRVQQLLDTAVSTNKPICILQPHGGKRQAMYTGFQILIQMKKLEAVVVTDSDTLLDPNALSQLAVMLDDPKVGAATGDVSIFNDDTVLSFLTCLRYWFAFNLERGCQSYHNVVSCVSGPLGIYRSSVIMDIQEEWFGQRFMGMECTYGDDRHLTNLTLKMGMRVKYTHKAICYTETPTSFFRWIVQQTRWSKSFFRESIYNVKWIHKHSLWMGYELLFQSFYPFLIIVLMFTILLAGTILQLMIWIATLFVVGFFRSFFAFLMTGHSKYFFYPVYSILYLFGFTIAKIQALLFLWDTNWGTSSRFKASLFKWKQTFIPVLWILGLLAAVADCIRRFMMDRNRGNVTLGYWILMGVIGGYLVLWVILYHIYQYVHQRRPKPYKFVVPVVA